MDGHRKFLKIDNMKPEIGAFFPDTLTVLDTIAVKFPWGEKNKSDGVICFFLSTHCTECHNSIGIIKEFSEKYPTLQYYVFTECSDDDFKQQKGDFSDAIILIKCEINVIVDRINLWGIPCVYTLNNYGQYLSFGIFKKMSDVEDISSLLIEVLDDKE